MTQWQPIETAPKDKPILLTGKRYGGYLVSVAEWANQSWDISPQVWEGSGEAGGLAEPEFDPTHWMPLPPPPDEESGGE